MAWIRAGRVPRWHGASTLAAALVFVAAVPTSAAGTWRIEAGSANGTAQLAAVSCVSATVCAAVGVTGNFSPTFKTYRGVAQRREVVGGSDLEPGGK